MAADQAGALSSQRGALRRGACQKGSGLEVKAAGGARPRGPGEGGPERPAPKLQHRPPGGAMVLGSEPRREDAKGSCSQGSSLARSWRSRSPRASPAPDRPSSAP